MLIEMRQKRGSLFVAGVNSDEYRSTEKSRGNWPQITSKKNQLRMWR